MAPASSWLSLVLFWGLAAHQHPLPNSTFASRRHILGHRQPPSHPKGQAERKGSQHCSNLMVGWTLTGTPRSLQALSFGFCGPTVLLNRDPCLHLQHVPALGFILQLFIGTKRATQQCFDSLSSSLDTSSWECEQPANLLKSSLLAPQMTSSP